MSDWRLKRFWKEATPVEQEGGWTIALDGRPIRTPARALLLLPTEALAREVAREWAEQDGLVRPDTMPFTRTSNSAIDKVAAQFDDVAMLLAEYGETDLVCYRADSPEELAQMQAEAWDPLIDWARAALKTPLVATAGLLPVAQPDHAVTAMRAAVRGKDIFALTALHDLVTLSGSLVIGLAAQDGVLPLEELWRRSRIDEDWQERHWGTDAEAAEAAGRKRADFMHAASFHALTRPTAR